MADSKRFDLSAALLDQPTTISDPADGEAARKVLSLVGASGLVVGADIAPAMIAGARDRLNNRSFCPVAADGQALPFKDRSFDAVICQLGLQFFPDPARGVSEFRRVLRKDGTVSICVISTPDRAPMWGNLAECSAASYRSCATSYFSRSRCTTRRHHFR